jgi:hypothetical protein
MGDHANIRCVTASIAYPDRPERQLIPLIVRPVTAGLLRQPR